VATHSALGKVIPKKQTAPILDSPQEYEEEEETFEVPNIEKLAYDLQASRQFNVVSLDKIAGTNKETPDDGYVRETDPTYSTASINEDFKKDAGSFRTPDAQT
jgi:hypothetical protein